MAVYTEVSDAELEAFLAEYDIGEADALKGVAEGVENSNYLLTTTQGQYFLTLYEKRVDPKDLPFFLGLMEHLADRGINCPRPIHGRDGQALRSLAGKPAAVTTFLHGMWPRRTTVKHCGSSGPMPCRLPAGGRCSRHRGATSTPRWRASSARKSTSSRPTGRRTCRPASSMPTCSMTMSSSCTTSCPA